jgi:alkylation response protein AidB-like acyl-CoA dehydrogenase
VIDFSTTPEQRALADAAGVLLRGRPDCGAADAAEATWHALAEFGALGLLTPAGGGGLGDVVALLDALGGGLCPGPVVASVAAGAVLSDDEARRLAAGELRVTVVAGGHVPWLATADVVLEVDGDKVWRVEAEAEDRQAETLSREPWPAARASRVAVLDEGPRFVVAAELGLAASLLGMARTLLDRGAAHARTREQFGRPIGEFQGVAHPLADAWAEVTAAGELVRLVAAEHDRGSYGPSGPFRDTIRARLARDRAAAAALQTAYAVHQTFGGLSFAEETGIGVLSTRLRQWSLLLPDLRAVAEALA